MYCTGHILLFFITRALLQGQQNNKILMLSSGDVFHLVSVIQGQVNQPLHKATDLREKVTVTSATTTVADVTGELFPFFFSGLM